jgi:Domain of unknown function (DUF4395)
VQPSSSGAVDARADRAAQAFVGVFLLGAFVFRLPWLVPLLALALAGAAIAGPRLNPFLFVYDRLVAPRLGAVDQRVDATTVQMQDVFTVGLVVLATLGLVLIKPFGWLVVIVAAIAAVLAASTGMHVGATVLRRFIR